MHLRKIWAVLVKEMRHILRAGSLLPTIFIPVLVMMIMSTAMAQDIRSVPISIMDADRSPLSRKFLAGLANSQDLVIGREAENYQQANTWFNQSLIKALVVIPAGFGDDLVAGRPTEIQVLVDGTDPATAEHVITQVVSRSQNFGFEQLLKVVSRELTTSQESLPIDLRVQEWYNPGLRNLTGIVPAMLAIALTLPAVNVMGALARERELGTMEILFATPLGRGELLIGKTLPYLVLGMISAVLCALAAVVVYGVPFRGAFSAYLIACLCFYLVSFGLGLLLSIFIRSQAVAMLGGLLILMFPAMFLSGIFYPVASMPAEMQSESQFLPATSMVAAVRGIMIKGQSLVALRSQILIMVVSGVVYLGLSIGLFKKKV